jgi:hypothetical protein
MDRGLYTLDMYGLNYPREPWQVQAVEGLLSFKTDLGDYFTGRIDLAVRTPDNRIYIVDHKTTRWGFVNLMRSLNVTDQTNGYIWLWNRTHPKLPADGMIFNIIRQYGSNPEFKQHLVTKTEADIVRFEKDANFLLDEIAKKMSNPDDPSVRWVRDTSACFKYNRPCPYLDLCRGDNYKGLMGVEFRKRTPDEQVYIETEE